VQCWITKHGLENHSEVIEREVAEFQVEFRGFMEEEARERYMQNFLVPLCHR